MADTLTVTNITDREFVDEHEQLLAHLEKLAANRRHTEQARLNAVTRIDTIDTAITDVGMKIRRGLVRYKLALDGTLPALLIDANLDRSVVAEITIRWNAAAEAHRSV